MEPIFHAQGIGQGNLPANALQLGILRNEAALISILLKENKPIRNRLISFTSLSNKKLSSGRRVPLSSQAILHSKGHSFSPRSFIYCSGSPPKPTKESAFFPHSYRFFKKSFENSPHNHKIHIRFISFPLLFMQGLQHAIRSNRMKTWLLIVLFPLMLGVALFFVFFFASNRTTYRESRGVRVASLASEERMQDALTETGAALALLAPVLMIWLLISFFFQRQLMFSFSWAKPVTRAQEPKLYNMIENLCISRGLPTPRIGIIETPGMNAFALGWRPKDSWIVFTRGLLNALEKSEIEAVAGHELTHIINKDSLLMLVMVLYIGAISLLGEILLRSGGRGGNSKNKNVLPLIGLVLLMLGYLFYPLVKLAISRKREYLADAGSVELTKDNQAMISALRKISARPEVKLDNKEMAAMFIANPFKKMSSLFQTHPSIEDRIKALEHY